MPPPPSGANQPVSVSRLQMQLHLQGLQQSTNALRKQLSQLRNMQVGEKGSDCVSRGSGAGGVEGSGSGRPSEGSDQRTRPVSGTTV